MIVFLAFNDIVLYSPKKKTNKQTNKNLTIRSTSHPKIKVGIVKISFISFVWEVFFFVKHVLWTFKLTFKNLLLVFTLFLTNKQFGKKLQKY